MVGEPKKTVHHVNVFADNFQFHLQDKVEECEFPETLNDNLLMRLFACGERVLVVGTVRDLDCEVTLEIYEEPMDEKMQEEEPDLYDFDHAGQGNLDIPSGKLLIHGCTMAHDDATTIEVKPGNYGVRIFWSNLDKTDTLGFEGDDQYLIQMWPDTHFDEVTLKFWRQLALQVHLSGG